MLTVVIRHLLRSADYRTLRRFQNTALNAPREAPRNPALVIRQANDVGVFVGDTHILPLILFHAADVG